MSGASRESEFPDRPSSLRRGSLGPLPLRAKKASAEVREGASLSLSGFVRLVRTLVVLAIIGVVGWRFVVGLESGELDTYKQFANDIYADIVDQVQGRSHVRSGEQQDSTQIVQQAAQPEASWLGHLNKAIKLAKSADNDEQAEAEFMNALFAAEEFRAPDERLTSVLDHFGYFYDQRGRYDEAVAYYLRALDGYRDSVGEKHEHFISLARRIGYAYRAQSIYQPAIDNLQLAVASARGLHGDDYVGIAYGYREIGDVELLMNNKVAALQSYHQGLDTAIRSVGPDHQLTVELMAAIDELE